jgi:AraC-like DNA-binding protein
MVIAERNQEQVLARVAWAMQAAAEATGIEVDMYDFFPDLDRCSKEGFITVEQQRKFARFIFTRPDETIGLRFGSNIRFQGLGVVGFLFRASPTYGDFIARAIRFHRVYARDPEYRIERRAQGIAMVFSEPDAAVGPRHQVLMGRMAKWISWGRQLCRADFSPCEARFRWEGPRDRAPFATYFNCRLSFARNEDCLLFDGAGIESPLSDYTPEMTQELEQYALALVEKLGSGEGFLSAVRVAIEDSLAGGSNSGTEVARRLALTPRTLHRRLEQEQTSYRQLRDLILQRHARALLRQPSMSLGEASYLLGYSDPSTFSRAFKRWTGVTPNEWRLQAK